MTQDPIDAVVFDFDGVLVHSIELHAMAYQSILRPLGVEITLHDVMIREGARSETIIRELADRDGVTIPDDRLKRLATLKQRAFEHLGQPRPYDAAGPVVEAIGDRGYPMAIVTGTRRKNVPAIAPELVPRFDHLVTQESYSHDKPHPEPYTTAADLLDIPPGRILVVENAPRGVASAKAAGMFTTAVTTTLPAEDLAEADLILDDLEHLLDVLAETPGSRPRLPDKRA